MAFFISPAYALFVPILCTFILLKTDTTPHEFEITEDGQIVKAEMTNEKESTPDTPQTGDSSMTGFFIGLGALALGGLVACVILFLKKKKDDGDDE